MKLCYRNAKFIVKSMRLREENRVLLKKDKGTVS